MSDVTEDVMFVFPEFYTVLRKRKDVCCWCCKSECETINAKAFMLQLKHDCAFPKACYVVCLLVKTVPVAKNKTKNSNNKTVQMF